MRKSCDTAHDVMALIFTVAAMGLFWRWRHVIILIVIVALGKPPTSNSAPAENALAHRPAVL
jgi:hypothetical protein